MAGSKYGPVGRGEKGLWYNGHWFGDLPLIEEEDRVMPDTRFSIYDRPRSSPREKPQPK